MPPTTTPLVVESAAGMRLRLAEPVGGVRELVDGISSGWAATTATGTRRSTRPRPASWGG
jgi:hypothetical protein